MMYLNGIVHNNLIYHDHVVAQGPFFLFSLEIHNWRVQMSWKKRASNDLEGPLEVPLDDLAGHLNVQSPETLHLP